MKIKISILLSLWTLSLFSQVSVFEVNHPTALSEDLFGCGVAISDEFAFVGSCYKDSGVGSVSAFFKENENWKFIEEFSPSDYIIQGLFGVTCSMTNKTLIVGAPGSFDSFITGQIYVFIRNGDDWFESQIVTPDNSFLFSAFGTAVSNTDNYILVGAPYHDDGGKAVVYVKENDQFVLNSQFSNPGGILDFGSFVSIDNDWAIVGGAHYDQTSQEKKKTICLYKNTGTEWMFTQQIILPYGSSTHSVGSADVEIKDDKLIFGGYRPTFQSQPQTVPGGIYVYNLINDEWVLEQDMKPEGYETKELGRAVSLSENFALAGTHKKISEDEHIQSLLIYDRSDDNNWKQIFDFDLPSNNYTFRQDVSNHYAIVGSPNGFNEPSTVYIFDLRTFSNIEEDYIEPRLTLFPNPCLDHLDIESEELIKNIIIYNVSGQIVKSIKNVNQHSLNINLMGLTSGSYSIQIESTKGKNSKTFFKK